MVEYQVSERHACRLMELARSTHRYRSRRAEGDRALRVRLQELAAKRMRFGYRRLTAMLGRELPMATDRVAPLPRGTLPTFMVDGLAVNWPKAPTAKSRMNISSRPHFAALRCSRGIVARVAEVIAHHDINIDSLEQEHQMPKDRVSFVITVEPISEPTIRRAVDAINSFDFTVEPVLLLRVE
jgi:hypothetical protein